MLLRVDVQVVPEQSPVDAVEGKRLVLERSERHDDAVGLEDGTHRLDDGRRVEDVLEHVEQDHRVEARVVVGKARVVGVDDGEVERGGLVPERADVAALEGELGTVGGDGVEQPAAAAAEFEHAAGPRQAVQQVLRLQRGKVAAAVAMTASPQWWSAA